MEVTQEMNFLIIQSQEVNIDAFTIILKNEMKKEHHKIIDIFLKNNIQKLNQLHDREFSALLQEQGTFYFYERKE